MTTYQPNQMGYNNYGNLQQPVQQYPYSNVPYNNYMNNQQPNVGQQFLKCRPVSSREEAMASQIDLDGSLWIFTDTTHGKIYTKQINNDGTASFNTYAYVKEEDTYNGLNTAEFVTKQEFNRVIQSLAAAVAPKALNPESAKTESSSPAPINFQ